MHCWSSLCQGHNIIALRFGTPYIAFHAAFQMDAAARHLHPKRHSVRLPSFRKAECLRALIPSTHDNLAFSIAPYTL
jgi:hypothetical protein